MQSRTHAHPRRAELVEHQPGSRLVGTDEFGNKYFEKMDTQVGA